jgi:hypothetical protein
MEVVLMEIRVVGAGVGRTGTHSLKVALEALLGAPCHHMLEILEHPEQMPGWMAAIRGEPADWTALLEPYGAIVDWPGAAFWRELAEAYPDALVLLSVRDPESWYKSASSTIFLSFDYLPSEAKPWMDSVRTLLRDRFSDQIDDAQVMMDAYVRHNETVRQSIPAARLLEWSVADGWRPICDRLGVAVPDAPFPYTNTTVEFRQMLGMPPLETQL